MEKKRVLFVIDSLTCGGAEKSLVSLLPLLDRNKYQIDLWVRSRGGVFETLVPKYINILDQQYYSVAEKTCFHLLLCFFSLRLRLNKVIRRKEHAAETLWKSVGRFIKIPKGEYDVAIAYQQGLPTYLVAEKIKAKKKLAWINVDIFKAGYDLQFNSRFYAKMNHIVSVSDFLFRLLAEGYGQFKEKYFCVYDILNPGLIRKMADETISDLNVNEISLLTVGRLVSPKNHLLAIETANALREKGLKFRWYFIGEGSEESRLRERIKELGLDDYVVLLGLRTNPYAYMKRCFIYVQTSSFEGFGLTVAEAKILHKPIVSTNFDVVRNQIKDGVNGLIAEMDKDSLSNRILELVHSSSLRDSLVYNLKKERNTTYFTEVLKVERLLDED